jgi:shikimate kinase
MGSGKSMIGKKLAASLHFPFLDIDQEFESQFKISIDSFFKKYGENVFRHLESKILKQTAGINEAVISTGGGTPCFYENMKFINLQGISVYLKVSPESIQKRIKQSAKPRPLLMNLPDDQLLEKITTMLNEREKFYNKAKITIESENIELETLLTALRNININSKG